MHESWLARAGAFLLGLLLALTVHAQSGGRIILDGSTGVMPLAAALAKAFQHENPDVAVEFGKGLGTKTRMAALSEGRIDVALASHGLDTAEIQRQGMSLLEVARTAVVFGVNASVLLTSVTEQQICDVYAGKASNWKALGAGDGEIAARTRPDTEVDAEVVRAAISCLKDLQMPAAVKVMPRAGDMARELAATAGAIGMTTMTVIEQSGGRIRPLSVNGVSPSADNVESKTYPLVRASFFVTRSAAPSPVARFLQFVRSPAGEKVIRANGAIPVR